MHCMFTKPANEVCEGYVFTGVWLSTGGACVSHDQPCMPPQATMHAPPVAMHAPPSSHAHPPSSHKRPPTAMHAPPGSHARPPGSHARPPACHALALSILRIAPRAGITRSYCSHEKLSRQPCTNPIDKGNLHCHCKIYILYILLAYLYGLMSINRASYLNPCTICSVQWFLKLASTRTADCVWVGIMP